MKFATIVLLGVLLLGSLLSMLATGKDADPDGAGHMVLASRLSRPNC